MSTERIQKALANCEQGLSSSEQAQARENIGAQGALTAGPNIDIINDIVSTEKAVLNAGANVSVTSVLDPQTRTVNYTISATGSSVNAAAPLYGDGTAADPLILRASHGLSLAQPVDAPAYLQVTHPVPAPGSASANKVLTCLDSFENLGWQDLPITPTGNATHPVFVNSNSEIEQCNVIPYTGSQVSWSLSDNVTIQSVTTEQDWALGPQRNWPYGFEPHEIDYSAIVTTPVDIIVRVYMHEFLYVNETYSPLPEELVWVGMVKAGTESLQWHICTKGLNNNVYTYNGRVTFQTLTATSGSIVVDAQCGNYHAAPRGYTLGTTPAVPAPPPWTPPSP